MTRVTERDLPAALNVLLVGVNVVKNFKGRHAVGHILKEQSITQCTKQTLHKHR